MQIKLSRDSSRVCGSGGRSIASGRRGTFGSNCAIRYVFAPSSDAGVKELVASVKKHKKFRQLASYSVQCLQKAISPPTVSMELIGPKGFRCRRRAVPEHCVVEQPHVVLVSLAGVVEI